MGYLGLGLLKDVLTTVRRGGPQSPLSRVVETFVANSYRLIAEYLCGLCELGGVYHPIAGTNCCVLCAGFSY
ncbi:MAG: hypothetical protein HBSAPP04_11270 [Ignavibacteriaceae bacterium]|nr:MAG: hypothetical protein HBSAPP04_11270 [Ignavibacteriaceae bacterium]